MPTEIDSLSDDDDNLHHHQQKQEQQRQRIRRQQRLIRQRQSSNTKTPAFVLLTIVTTFCFLLLYLIAQDDPMILDDEQPTKDIQSSSTTKRKSHRINNLKSNLVKEVTTISSELGLTKRRQQLRSALKSLQHNNIIIPYRLQKLRQEKEIIGERLIEIREGKETVEEVLHGTKHHTDITDKPPMTLKEIIDFLDNWIHSLHSVLKKEKNSSFVGIWKAYHDLTVKTLYPWDREYIKRMPKRRNDGSIFLSLASYRDENCINTIRWAYDKAKNPEKLFIGLVQQNCHHDCKSGILDSTGKQDTISPDDNCYEQFCNSSDPTNTFAQELCNAGNIRVLNIDEPESLGPYAARYFASKLWYGEEWFMQTDAHMTFVKDWDAISIKMLQAAPVKKPVMSHYPPAHTQDLEAISKKPASRLCGPMFATSDLEEQIIRLEGAGYDNEQLEVPRFAPFTAAGYFVAHSDFLREVPFDPFLPWIFMGEEIIMSARLWTAGYDIFSPIQSVVGHMYVRRHKPKFWESVHRAFTFGIHNSLQALVLQRIKYQLGYPESAKDMIMPKSILTAVEQYGMGKERSLETYLQIVGLNMTTKLVTYTGWCEEGKPPPGFEQYNHYYE